MNDALKEQVSALLDGELRREEKALLLRRLSQSPDLAQSLGRYSLIGETMRRQTPAVVHGDLAARISARLQEEETLSTRRGAGWRAPLARPLAGMAVAATVAAVSIALWPASQSDVGGQPMLAGSAPTHSSPSGFVATSSAHRPTASSASSGLAAEQSWDRLNPQVQQRMNAYYINHTEHSARGQFGGALPYVRITGQEHVQ